MGHLAADCSFNWSLEAMTKKKSTPPLTFLEKVLPYALRMILLCKSAYLTILKYVFDALDKKAKLSLSPRGVYIVRIFLFAAFLFLAALLLQTSSFFRAIISALE